jgi:8-oxo-dGTP pyrophosphatase MutT (NUDIX family)
MFFKKDRPSNTNYGYTFKSSWNYRPKQNVENTLNYSNNSNNKTKEPPARRGGIIFLNKNEDIKDTKFLVVRGKDTGIWSFPKGRMDDNEDEEVCAIREVYEETGILIDNLKENDRLKLGRNTYFIINVDDINKYNTFNIKDTFEVDVVEWKTFSELKKLSCNKDIRAIITYPEKQYTYHNLIFSLQT